MPEQWKFEILFVSTDDPIAKAMAEDFIGPVYELISLTNVDALLEASIFLNLYIWFILIFIFISLF